MLVGKISIMLRIKAIIFIFSFSLLANASSAGANCLIFGDNERLSNFCLLESVQGRIVDQKTAAIVTQKLRQEGYFGGLGTLLTTVNVYPDASYSNNINGGNPDKPLIIGDVEFEGESNLVAKKGIVFGLNLQSSARKTYGEGKYINAYMFGAFFASPAHNLTFTNARIGLCSKNKFTENMYFDACALAGTQNKEITKDTSQTITASLSKLKKLDGFGFVEKRIGFTRLITNNYSQNQANISFDAIHLNDLYSTVTIQFGEKLHNQLVMRRGINAALSSLFDGKKYSLSLSHQYSSGGILLGVSRFDTINKVTVTTNISATTQISVGLTQVESTIDYYDQIYPSVALTHTW